jgi:hypothetical protein
VPKYVAKPANWAVEAVDALSIVHRGALIGVDSHPNPLLKLLKND